MRRLLKWEQVLTIPNLLSMLRLLMIPAIVWLYCKKVNYNAAAGMIILSALTDIADGIIARKCNMVSDLGKILDPIADKLTQGTLIFCLISKYEWMLWLLIFFVIKEIAMGVSGLFVLKKKDVINSAQWFGKLSTVILYAVLFLLFLFPNISTVWVNIMILLCAVAQLLSIIKYQLFYGTLLRDRKR